MHHKGKCYCFEYCLCFLTATKLTKSPYLDQFGEEDVSLRRGRPLFLHAPLLDDLRRRFICSCLVDKTINTGMRLLLPSWRTF
jgi:hypothetical protein